MNWQCLSGEGRKGQAFWIRKRCTDWFWFLWLSLTLSMCAVPTDAPCPDKCLIFLLIYSQILIAIKVTALSPQRQTQTLYPSLCPIRVCPNSYAESNLWKVHGWDSDCDHFWACIVHNSLHIGLFQNQILNVLYSLKSVHKHTINLLWLLGALRTCMHI